MFRHSEGRGHKRRWPDITRAGHRMEGKDGKWKQYKQGKANPVPDRHGTGYPAGKVPKDGHKAASEATAKKGHGI